MKPSTRAGRVPLHALPLCSDKPSDDIVVNLLSFRV